MGRLCLCLYRTSCFHPARLFNLSACCFCLGGASCFHPARLFNLSACCFCLGGTSCFHPARLFNLSACCFCRCHTSCCHPARVGESGPDFLVDLAAPRLHIEWLVDRNPLQRLGDGDQRWRHCCGVAYFVLEIHGIPDNIFVPVGAVNVLSILIRQGWQF